MLFVASFANAQSRTQALLGVESTSYFSQLDNSTAPVSFSLLHADIRSYRPDGRYLGWGVNGGFAYITDTRDPLIKVNEAFIATVPAPAENWQLTAGRRLYNWSQMDSDWKLGLWQPRYRWDYLDPELQGLTGVFFRAQQSDWEFVVLGAPVFIPEQGAPLKSEGGTIVSSSRWVSQPASKVNLLNYDTPMNYYINVPPSREIIDNPGGAAYLRLGDRSQGVWAHMAYAYKPMNQLLLSANPDNRLRGREIESADIAGSATGVVQIHPRVIYHQLSEVTAGYSQSEEYAVWLSVLNEQPIMDNPPNRWISQQVAPTFLMSPGVSYDFPAVGPRPTRLKASVLKQWGGDARDSGELANSSDKSLFEPRYPFRNAFMTEFQMPWWWSGQRVLIFSVRGIYEWEDQGVVFSTKFHFQPAAMWQLLVGADLLGQWGGENDSNLSFGSRYRGNDRVFGGVNYVF